MARNRRRLVIDARPRGPRGPLAGERLQGRTVLDHLLDAADACDDRPASVAVHARSDEHPSLAEAIRSRPEGRFVLAVGPPPEGAAVLRSDRVYDLGKLRNALRRGRDPESAVVWRLDRPHALDVADEELARRRSYQPIGRFWALEPARRLARTLAPTRVRPNAVTLLATSCVLAASALVARGPAGASANLLASGLLAAALVLDTADGHLARLQGTTSAFGRWLDGWLDEVGDMALHAAAAWAAFERTGRPAWLLAGMLYGMGKYVFAAATVPEAEPNEAPPDVTRSSTPSPLRAAVRLAGHADVRWHLWIVLAALGRLDLGLVAYAAYYPARAALVAAGKAVRRA